MCVYVCVRVYMYVCVCMYTCVCISMCACVYVCVRVYMYACVYMYVGNDIASAFISILKQIIKDNPDVVDLLCWSDSCVPQNRNSHISQAILEFLQKNQHINSITMKYSLPGHSCVQEVDNMHKQIEDAMQVAEFYSPISFLRLLLKVNRQAPYRVIQMVENNFKDYMNSSKLLQFNLVPYQKVFQLTFSQNLHCVEFKFSW